jgi:hypothetical protein
MGVRIDHFSEEPTKHGTIRVLIEGQGGKIDRDVPNHVAALALLAQTLRNWDRTLNGGEGL